MIADGKKVIGVLLSRLVHRLPYPARMLRDSFDYATYWSLLSRTAATHRILRFADLREAEPPPSFCILRHDVDYSPKAALRLAEQESARGSASHLIRRIRLGVQDAALSRR